MTHPSRRLDDAVHQRTRLGILTVLCESGQADFGYLRRTLDLTDGNLSRNLSKLEEAGLIRSEKAIENRRSRTWLTVTSAGREALRAEIEALRDLIARVDAAPAKARPLRAKPA